MTKENPYLLTKHDLLNQLREDFTNNERDRIDSFILKVLADIEKGKFWPVLSDQDVKSYGGKEKIQEHARNILIFLK